ncbi:hypothetical protein [Candidatus Pantoea formicae]|uniref:hypothetical protein n=1 Tax=Candidatus Pantoea formicae TaxID=2608355 RepID=UPI003ED9C042
MSNFSFAIKGIGVIFKRLVNVKKALTFLKDLSLFASFLSFFVLAFCGGVFLVVKILTILLQPQPVSDPNSFFGVPLINHVINFLNNFNAEMSDSMFFKVGIVCFFLCLLKSVIDVMCLSAPGFVYVYRYLVALGKDQNH